VLGKSFKDYDNVLIFSAHQAKRIIDIVKLLKALNNSIKYILLPHGVTLCSNDMLSNNNMSKNNNIVDFSDRWKDMDYIFLSDNTLKNKAILSGVPLENLKLVGSARFCQEWLDIKKDIQIDGSIVVNKKNKKNILFLMPNMISNIFYDEVVRTIEFISQYDDISFIVQYRANEINLPKHIKNIHNITWITSEYTTSALIDWCDIAIHAVTTMQFECFQKKKIVVYPRYLMANTAICELYSAGVILKNRDDLRNTMNEISSDFNSFKGKYFSNEKNINKFIGDYVNAGGEMPALNNYINTIENIIKERE
jgi:hypothetical protein